MQRALLAHLLDLPLQPRDARADQSTVGLQLRLAGPARTDRAFQPFEVLPLPAQPRQQVLVLREFHLQRRLPGARAAGKDVEDQRTAVDHLHLQRGFKVQLLRRRQLLVEDDEGVIQIGASGADFLELAGADVGGRVRARAPL